MNKEPKTKLLVDRTEWERIETAIRSAFKEEGISSLYAARALDIVASIIYDCKGSQNYGKNGFNRRATHRSREFFKRLFRDPNKSAKAKKILEHIGILLEDESWCANNLDHPDGTWTISYAVDYNPKNPETYAVWFPSNASIIENAISKLRTVAKELDYDTSHKEKLHIDKAGITAAVRAGEIDPDDFATFVSAFKKYPDLKSCKSIGHENDKRMYTPLAMIRKELLRFVLNENGVSVKEIADIHSSFIVSILFATGNTSRFLSVVRSIYDDRWYRKDGHDVQNTLCDLYNRILNHIETEDRNTNLFYGATSQKEKRDEIKKFCQAVIFASDAERKKWDSLKNRAFEEMKTHTRVSKFVYAMERAARIKCAIQDYFQKNEPDFWEAVMTAEEIEDLIVYETEDGRTIRRKKAKKTPLFWTMTQGEEVLMAYIRSQLIKRFGFSGISTYRKHDAILACVETAPTEAQSDTTVGTILMGISDCGKLKEAFNDYARKAVCDD